MLARPTAFQVINGGLRPDGVAIKMPGRFMHDETTTQSLNTLLHHFGSKGAVSFGDENGDDILSTEAQGPGPAFSATPVRGYRGICKGLVSDLDVIIATSTGTVSHDLEKVMMDALQASMHVARRFGRKRVLILDTDPTIGKTVEEAWSQQNRTPGITVGHDTLAGFMDKIVRGESCNAVLAVMSPLYQPLCDLLIGMSGSAPMTIQATLQGGLGITAAQTGAEWTYAALIPALILTMVLDGELSSARTLERSWLKSLEDGLITEGIRSIRPYEKRISFHEFCQAIIDNLNETPRKLAPSLAPQSTIGATLSLV